MAPLCRILKLNSDLFNNCLVGISDETACTRISDRMNNIAFIALHLVDARCYLVRYIGLRFENPFENLENIQSIDDMTDFPTLDYLRSGWQKVTPVLYEQLDKLTEAQLRSRSPESFPVDDDSVLSGIAFLLQHESYHIGQLSFLRKYLALGPMSYKH